MEKSDLKTENIEDLSVQGDSVVVNQYAAKEKEPPAKRKWIIPVLTTIIGVLATVMVAWYQLKVTEEQALQAALERKKSVVHNVVQIVEEHVINNNSLDIPRLARLIDLRSREEKLPSKISVIQVIQKAEFNIINTSYLAFEKKSEYKKVFDSIYSQMSFEGLEGYSGSHENIANELAKSIRSGDHETAITTLNSLLDLFNQDLQQAKTYPQKNTISLTKLFGGNFFYIVFGIQLMLLAIVIILKQLTRKRAEIEYLRRHQANNEWYTSPIENE